MPSSLSNIIKDGSFEIASPPTGDWSNIGAPTAVVRDTGEPDNYGGQYSVRITSAGAGNEGIKATLSNLKPLTRYTVRVRAKATAADTAKIWTTGAATNLSKTTTSTSFVDLIGFFVTDVTPTAVVLNIGSDTSGDIVWFDKLMVVEGEGAFAFTPSAAAGGLWESDGDTKLSTPEDVDFQQKEALQFVIENRTSDPGSPVAGQAWFRTDL